MPSVTIFSITRDSLGLAELRVQASRTRLARFGQGCQIGAERLNRSCVALRVVSKSTSHLTARGKKREKNEM